MRKSANRSDGVLVYRRKTKREEGRLVTSQRSNDIKE